MSHKKRILIVEDEPALAKLTSFRLKSAGYEVIIAVDGRQGLKMAGKERPDLIVLDLELPVMDGLETFEGLKKKITSPPPVIMRTAHSSLNLALAFMKAGGTDFIQKPLDIEVLDVKIRQALRAQELQRKLVEARIARQASEEAGRQKSIFLASISHQLRTPLTSVIGFAQTLKRMAERDNLPCQKLEEFLEKILRSAARLEEQVNEILDVTLLEEGMKLAYEKVSIQQIIADLAPDFAKKARAKSLKLRVSLADDLPPVRSDRKRLSQIFSNLLDNAIKFTETGAVELKAGEKENSVLISISDTGLGIPETELPHIFDGFSQIDRSGARPGIGLGLFICKKLTDLMDGELRVESEIGRGCIFYLSLPKWKDQ